MQTGELIQLLRQGTGSVESKSKEIFIMSTITSKHGKRQAIVDPTFLLAFLVLILALLAFTPFTANLYNSVGNAVGSFETWSASLSASPVVSFNSDLQYWEQNCSHGWSSATTCDAIVARSQSCSVSVASAYCSAYESYLEQFHN